VRVVSCDCEGFDWVGIQTWWAIVMW
jgi:hypothetical protein